VIKNVGAQFPCHGLMLYVALCELNPVCSNCPYDIGATKLEVLAELDAIEKVLDDHKCKQCVLLQPVSSLSTD